MATLNEILQDMVNESYDDLVDIAQGAMEELLLYLKDFAGDEQSGANIFLGFIASSLAADGKLSETEYHFVCDVLRADYTYDEVKELAQRGVGDDMRQSINYVIDNLPKEMKSKALVLCCAFMAADETISREEVGFIHYLVED